MPKRDFLAVTDLSKAEILDLFRCAAELKAGGGASQPLAGRTLAMIFAKSSTRTRVSFEVGMYQLGGHALFLSSRDIQLGRGEPIKDTARVISGYVDGIMIRTFAHGDVEEFAAHATVPVINGLTDLLHPCQVLTDMFTVQEAIGDLEHRVVAWIGDGNNMANSWLNAAATMGFELRLACPEGYEPDRDILTTAEQKTKVTVTRDTRRGTIEHRLRGFGCHVAWAKARATGREDDVGGGLVGPTAEMQCDAVALVGDDLSRGNVKPVLARPGNDQVTGRVGPFPGRAEVRNGEHRKSYRHDVRAPCAVSPS